MRVLVVGGGGREHAIVRGLTRNLAIDRLYAAPGNAGIAELATPVAIGAADVAGLADFAEREAVDLTVVGPEAPLVAGLADELQARGLKVFGPTKDAARIEGSKSYARSLCERHGIPAPRARAFTDADEASAYLAELEPPFVVKADGLAAGKGVTVTEDRVVAQRAIVASLLDRAFGDAGDRVLLEEYLEGQEVSVLALTDGTTVLPLPPAQDYKRAFDGDAGPNTGGMGAYSPVPFVEAADAEVIERDILQAAVRALAAEGVRYRGVLYAGVMLTGQGPKVLEFNCRFGDPETQAVLPRIDSDLGETLLACVEGNLSSYRPRWSPRACVTVVVAADGYPGSYPTGVPIEGLDAAAGIEDAIVFHSGTARRDGKVVTAGGRVLSVSALGDDLAEARDRAYETCSLIRFEGMHYRTDIAERVVEATRG